MNIAHNSLGTSIHDGWMKGKKLTNDIKLQLGYLDFH